VFYPQATTSNMSLRLIICLALCYTAVFATSEAVTPLADVEVDLLSRTRSRMSDHSDLLSILRTDIDIPLTSDSFVKFTELHNKYYATAEEATRRMTHFMEYAVAINQQNAQYLAGNSTWFAGLNEDHDLSNAERIAQNTGYIHDATAEQVNTAPVSEASLAGVQLSSDWTGHLSGIQKQGCGDCWAFGSGAALEFKCGKNSVNEAEIRDCSGSGTCKGGNPVGATKWACSRGVESRKQYPVLNSSPQDQQCKASGGSCKCSHVATGSGASTLKKWVSKGVVSVTVAAGGHSFAIYRGGLFTGDCSGSVDHSVSVVGFDGKNYKLRNQWGTSWGAGGYMTIAAGQNKCKVEGAFSMPQ
jgi:C1A family cysteine protease